MAKQRELPIDVSDLNELTYHDIKFIAEYCGSGDFDEVKAYKKVFPTQAKSMAHSQIKLEGYKVLNQPQVKMAVQRFIDMVIQPSISKFQMSAFGTLKARMTWKPTDFFNDDHSPKKLSQIPEDKLVCIDNINNDLKGARADNGITNFKLADRMEAYREMQKMFAKAEAVVDTPAAVAEEHRNRVNDIMAGAMAGIEAANRSRIKEHEMKQAQRTQPAEVLQIEEPDTAMVVEMEAFVEEVEKVVEPVYDPIYPVKKGNRGRPKKIKE